MTLLTLIWLPLLAAPVVYLAGRLAGRARELALLALLATWTPFVILVMGKGDAAAFTYGAITLQWDGLSLLLALTALGLGTVVTLYSYAYMADETGTEKYYAMLVAMIGVMIGLGCARDLFNLWLWFEAMAVSSYLLVAFYREQPASLEAGSNIWCKVPPVRFWYCWVLPSSWPRRARWTWLTSVLSLPSL